MRLILGIELKFEESGSVTLAEDGLRKVATPVVMASVAETNDWITITYYKSMLR